MFKKYNQLIIGFVLGAVLFSAMPIKAAIEEFLCYKADYKVVVNGTEYISPDLPILNYKGYTYAPFRSILESAGLDVNWNAELSQAEVTSPTTLNTEVKSMSTTTKPTSTPDGITNIDEWEGKYYIAYAYIQNKLKGTDYDLFFNPRSEKWELKKSGNVIVNEMPFKNIYGADSFEYDYYVNTILPLIK